MEGEMEGGRGREGEGDRQTHTQRHMLTQTDRQQQLECRNVIHVHDTDQYSHLG